jgi:hypothetical protein
MRKTLFIGLLVAFGQIANAQTAEVSGPSANDSVRGTSTVRNLEERINKQEVEIEVLKKDNQTFKKQIKQLSPSPVNSGRKITVSRTGSKQVVFE